MSAYTKNLKQTCVYWAPAIEDAFGRQSTSSPVELNCRWVNTQKKILDANAEQVLSVGKVFLGQDVALGGFLKLTTLAEVESSGNPDAEKSAFQIKSFQKIPNTRGDKFLRVAYI